MELQNCARCGTLYVKQKSEYCGECTGWIAEKYGQIRDYLRTYPNRTIWDVHRDLELPVSLIQQILKDPDSK